MDILKAAIAVSIFALGAFFLAGMAHPPLFGGTARLMRSIEQQPKPPVDEPKPTDEKPAPAVARR